MHGQTDEDRELRGPKVVPNAPVEPFEVKEETESKSYVRVHNPGPPRVSPFVHGLRIQERDRDHESRSTGTVPGVVSGPDTVPILFSLSL